MTGMVTVNESGTRNPTNTGMNHSTHSFPYVGVFQRKLGGHVKSQEVNVQRLQRERGRRRNCTVVEKAET